MIRKYATWAVVGVIGVITCAAFAQFKPLVPADVIASLNEKNAATPVAPFDGVNFLRGSSPFEGGIAAIGPGIQAAADELMNDQCPDGGWGWPHGGCAPTYHNVTDPIGLGLMHAFQFTGDTHHKAAIVAAGDFNKSWVFGNGEPQFAAFTPAFLHKLTAFTGNAAYSHHVAVFFFDPLMARTYGPLDMDTDAWIADLFAFRIGPSINLRTWDLQYLPWVAGLIGNPNSTTPADGISQQQKFLDALLDSINTLDRSDPNVVTHDMLGLAGAIRGLALNGTTDFPPIVAPKFTPINGMATLKALADRLVMYQNPDGSWYRSTNLNLPTTADKCSQATAYAVLALIAADPLVTSDYTMAVEKAREYLNNIQLPTGGHYCSGACVDQNVEVDAEVLNAMEPEPCEHDKLAYEIASDSICVKPGEPVTIELWQRNLLQLVRGYQVFGQFDSTMLTFNGAMFEETPYGLILRNQCVGPDFDLSGGINDLMGQPPTQADAKLVTLTFTAGATEGPTVISMRFRDPPSRFGDQFGVPIEPCLTPSATILIDGTPPIITGPADKTVYADAGLCTATVDPGMPVCDDNLNELECVVTYKRSDRMYWNQGLLEDYPLGTTQILWRATDCAGNFSERTQSVIVEPLNEVVVDIELSPTMFDPDIGHGGDTIQRCITFEFWNLPDTAPLAVVDEVFTFDVDRLQPHMATGSVTVPCGIYNCVTARDRLHTLRQTVNSVDIVDLKYSLKFTTAEGDALVNGNLFEDEYIDIMDFTVFSWKWGTQYASRHTNCATPFPHADIDGNRTVWTGDFTFIAVNYLKASEPNCASIPSPLFDDEDGGPITRISVAELGARGLSHLAAGDLNSDGWVDTADVMAFLGGARPQSPALHGATPRR